VIGDRAGLVAGLKALVAQLEDDIRARIGEVPELRAHLADEHRKATAAQRTAMSVEEWREGEITQAAVAWVLACVFVRFLEDNGLIDSPLISGAGDRRTAALGHREEHFREHPEHSDREYLESVFGRAASHPGVAPLYDRRHNPLWQLGPTADGARELREFWTRIDPDTGALVHDFSDPELGTRFLGDLYQDLSETAKKRYALLQTPEFVEEFILDRTLDPAIEEFGLDQVRMIDPTCGSGHFLIGAFERLFARWRDREPGTAAEVLAHRALDAVHGVDLNPFATAIARFRLLVAALRACNIGRLSEAPDFRLNLATGDSLLHGAEPGQFEASATTARVSATCSRPRTLTSSSESSARATTQSSGTLPTSRWPTARCATPTATGTRAATASTCSRSRSWSASSTSLGRRHPESAGCWPASWARSPGTAS